MTAKLISGNEIAKQIREELAGEVAQLKAKKNVVPGLVTILVGQNPASVSYVTAKQKTSKELGFYSIQDSQPETISEEHLFKLIDQFYVDAENGDLPQVAYVDPAFFGDESTQSDEHPPSNVQVGQAFTSGVINALMQSPNWPRSVMFLMYDEHGGYYDHVVPPAACVPDAIPPDLQPGDEPGAFDRYGIRVPFVVVSPFARKRYVSHTVTDQTAVLRFIETRFDLPALTARDANSDPPFELFDFANPAFLTPPVLPDAEIDPVRAAECTAP